MRRGRKVLTTPLVLWECGNAAARRPFRQSVNVLRQIRGEASHKPDAPARRGPGLPRPTPFAHTEPEASATSRGSGQERTGDDRDPATVLRTGWSDVADASGSDRGIRGTR